MKRAWGGAFAALAAALLLLPHRVSSGNVKADPFYALVLAVLDDN